LTCQPFPQAGLAISSSARTDPTTAASPKTWDSSSARTAPTTAASPKTWDSDSVTTPAAKALNTPKARRQWS